MIRHNGIAVLSARCAAIVALGALLAGAACEDNADTVVAQGRELYNAALPTVGGENISCAECHGPNGAGGSAGDLQRRPADDLQVHAQGGGAHPDGIKYPDLTATDFHDIAHFLGAEDDAGDHHDDGPSDMLVGDAERGRQLFTTPVETAGAGVLSCATCHATDGSSGFGPDIRGQPSDHLDLHAQGGGRHPAGVKYPDSTAQDFADMEAYLALESDPHPDPDHSETDEHKQVAKPAT